MTGVYLSDWDEEADTVNLNEDRGNIDVVRSKANAPYELETMLE